jgi:hypothetical protein
VSHYKDAFPNTHLLMRRPFAIAQKLNLGLYNDMAGDVISTRTWLNWVGSGGDFDQTGEKNGLVPMPDSWLIAPVGGEQAPSISDDEFYNTELERSLELLRKSHATFIGPNGPYNAEYGGALQDGINQVLSTIGYRLSIKEVKMLRWTLFEKKIKVQLDFVNNGSAPMYYNWPANIFLLDDAGKTIYVSQVDMDVRKIIPDETYKVYADIPVGSLKSGIYSIGIAISDPQTNQPAVQFSMENNRKDLIYELGSFEVIRIFDFQNK